MTKKGKDRLARIIAEVRYTGISPRGIDKLLCTLSSPPAKRTYQCPNCGYSYGYQRKLKLRRSCGICSPGVFNEKYIMRLVE